MQIIKYPPKEEWVKILQRPLMDTAILDNMVKKVLEDVKREGDKALLDYTARFDKVVLDTLQVSKGEISEANANISPSLKNAIKAASDNIEKFHTAQKQKIIKIETMPGVTCWQKSVAIEKVGLYIPGGTAPLFSTVLMLGIPAKVAGCQEIILCTPPNKKGRIDEVILFAASYIGIDKIFKIGGAQAIAAMAYGTATISKVYKIFGPGNQYVTAAKQIVMRGDVAIDMPAGPSEVAVMADETANPEFVASDLLSQAEHGGDSQVILVTTKENLINQVLEALNKQLETTPRKEFALESLENSRAIVVKNMDEMIALVNEYAPEHLIISTQNPEETGEKIINAGSVFLGNYTPESAGDYASGTNHTLPTYGYAKAYNGVNLDNYVKKITYQEITKKGLTKIGPVIQEMALAEKLYAHANAVKLRVYEK